MDPYFIFMPIENDWGDYTGQPRAERDGVVKKLEHQLKSQGFNNYLFVDESKPYSHVDGAHGGRQSWVEVDAVLNPFLMEPVNKNINYQMNDYFYSKEWQEEKIN